ncbi:MAG: AAC(3) family N-acetyltransferase [Paracoccaceae bacterium]|nr:AAC(3) family N-acetyltransferase [Paracoccaceae bacterium]
MTSHPDISFSTRESLLRDFKRLGLHAGDGVFVHASMKSLGPVVGGPRTVVSALIDAVGEDGLIAMPGFSTDAYMPDWFDAESADAATVARVRDAVPGHDTTLTPCREMGVIAETFRTWPGTERSAHPCVSVAARGLDSAAYLDDHSLAWACGPDSPMGRFCARPNMKIMLLGVGWTRCSALHTAETLVAERRTKRRVFKQDGAWHDTPDVADDKGRLFPLVGQSFDEVGSIQRGTIGQADTRLFPYADLVTFAANELETLLKTVHSSA